MDFDPLVTFIVGTFAALALPFLVYGVVSVVKQVAGGSEDGDATARRDREVAALRQRVLELEERMEFTERLLAREGRAPEALPQQEQA